MKEPARFAESVYERIAGYLPPELHKTYYSYLAHVRTFSPDDQLVVMLEGMAILALITRQVPEAVHQERETFLAALEQVFAKQESAMSGVTADTRAMFAAHQKLLEQNMGAWQSRERKTVDDLTSVSTKFERSVDLQLMRLTQCLTETKAAIIEHKAVAEKTRYCLSMLSWHQLVWPCTASAGIAATVVLAVVYFRAH